MFLLQSSSGTEFDWAMQRLQNRIAIVTGGAHGIGKAIAQIFAGECAKVFIADLDEIASKETVANSAKGHEVGKCAG